MAAESSVLVIEALARESGVNAEALKKWHQRRRVPHRWRLPLIDLARANGHELDQTVFDDFRAAREPVVVE